MKKNLHYTSFFLVFLITLAFSNKSIVKKIDKELKYHDKELTEIKKKIKQGQKNLKKIEKKEKNVLKKLHQIEDNLDITYRYIRKLGSKESILLLQTEELKIRIDTLSDSLKYRRKIMEKRLRSIYKKGETNGFMEAFLGASTFAEGFERNRFFMALSKYDKKLLNSIIITKTDLEDKINTVKEKLLEIQDVREEKQKEKQSLLKQKVNKKSVLKKIKSKKDTYIELVKELKNSQKELTKLISSLVKTKKKEASADKLKEQLVRERSEKKYKGEILWPVNGKVIRHFGRYKNKKYKTITINSGIDIKAKEGTAVIAVASGKVAYIGRMRGYGNILIVEHSGEFYSLYSHLLEIIVNKEQKLEQGQIIGRVGDTGSFEGSKLHFEFRRGKKVLNPEKWLKKRR